MAKIQVEYDDGEEETLLLAVESVNLPPHLCRASAPLLPGPSIAQLAGLGAFLQAKAFEFSSEIEELASEGKRGNREMQDKGAPCLQSHDLRWLPE